MKVLRNRTDFVIQKKIFNSRKNYDFDREKSFFVVNFS